MTIATVNVLLLHNQKVRTVRTWAVVVDGGFAVHRTWMSRAKRGRRGQAPGLWTITHIPTGLALSASCRELTRDEIPTALEWAKSIKFAGRGFGELHACDALEFAQEVAAANDIPWLGSEDWEENRMLAAAALGCNLAPAGDES